MSKHETLGPVEGSPHVKVWQPHPKVEPSNHFESLRLRLQDEGLGFRIYRFEGLVLRFRVEGLGLGVRPEGLVYTQNPTN